MNSQDNGIELRSERARNVIGQIPPTIVRTGIVSIVLVFIFLIAGAAIIPFQPQIKVSAMLKGTPNSFSGEVLLPKGSISICSQQLAVRVSPYNTNLNLSGTIILNQRRLVVNPQGAFWSFPISINAPDYSLDTLVFKGNINATISIELPKTTLLRWAITNLRSK